MPQATSDRLSYDHFGGRTSGTPGYRPEESQLVAWASSVSFSPIQAEAHLVSKLPDLFPKTSLKTPWLSLKKTLYSAHVKSHNKACARQLEKKITALTMSINPMHLLVQHTFLKSQVVANGWHIEWQLDLRHTGLFDLTVRSQLE